MSAPKVDPNNWGTEPLAREPVGDWTADTVEMVSAGHPATAEVDPDPTTHLPVAARAQTRPPGEAELRQFNRERLQAKLAEVRRLAVDTLSTASGKMVPMKPAGVGAFAEWDPEKHPRDEKGRWTDGDYAGDPVGNLNSEWNYHGAVPAHAKAAYAAKATKAVIEMAKQGVPFTGVAMAAEYKKLGLTATQIKAIESTIAVQPQRYADIHWAQKHWDTLGNTLQYNARTEARSVAVAVAKAGLPYAGEHLDAAAKAAKLSEGHLVNARTFAVLNPEKVRDEYENALKGMGAKGKIDEKLISKALDNGLGKGLSTSPPVTPYGGFKTDEPKTPTLKPGEAKPAFDEPKPKAGVDDHMKALGKIASANHAKAGDEVPDLSHIPQETGHHVDWQKYKEAGGKLPDWHPDAPKGDNNPLQSSKDVPHPALEKKTPGLDLGTTPYQPKSGKDALAQVATEKAAAKAAGLDPDKLPDLSKWSAKASANVDWEKYKAMGGKLPDWHPDHEAQAATHAAAAAMDAKPKFGTSYTPKQAQDAWTKLTPSQQTVAKDIAAQTAQQLAADGKPVTHDNMMAIFAAKGFDTSAVSKGAVAHIAINPESYGLHPDAAYGLKPKTPKGEPLPGAISQPDYQAAQEKANKTVYESNHLGLPVIPGTKAAGTTGSMKTGDVSYSQPGGNVLNSYHNSGYGGLNSHLRQGGEPGQSAATLTALIEGHAVPYDATVYRSFAAHSLSAGQMKQGLVFTDHGFTSTDTTGNTAMNWSGDTLLAIKLPKGARALYMKNHIGETEMLVQRGSTYRVTAKIPKKVGGKQVWEAELIYQHQFASPVFGEHFAMKTADYSSGSITLTEAEH